MFRLNATDFTHGVSFGFPAVIRLPESWERRELQTWTGIFNPITGRIVFGWRTFAPKNERSNASSKDRTFTFRGEGTTLGSAVRIPSTSVQICTSSTSNAAPITDAE